jgi:hypothetical protein
VTQQNARPTLEIDRRLHDPVHGLDALAYPYARDTSVFTLDLHSIARKSRLRYLQPNVRCIIAGKANDQQLTNRAILRTINSLNTDHATHDMMQQGNVFAL